MDLNKDNADIMFQTDFETQKSRSLILNQWSKKSEKSSKQISPKYFDLKLNSKHGSVYSFKASKLTKKARAERHFHNHHKAKPLEKIYHNPILIKNQKVINNLLKLPEIKSAFQTPRSYLKCPRISINIHKKLKYLSILDSFHLSG